MIAITLGNDRPSPNIVSTVSIRILFYVTQLRKRAILEREQCDWAQQSCVDHHHNASKLSATPKLLCSPSSSRMRKFQAYASDVCSWFTATLLSLPRRCKCRRWMGTIGILFDVSVEVLRFRRIDKMYSLIFLYSCLHAAWEFNKNTHIFQNP
jgi:hypothetical protein